MNEAVSHVATQTDKLACPDVWTFGERTNMRMERRCRRRGNPNVREAMSHVATQTDKLACPDVWTFGECRDRDASPCL